MGYWDALYTGPQGSATVWEIVVHIHYTCTLNSCGRIIKAGDLTLSPTLQPCTQKKPNVAKKQAFFSGWGDSLVREFCENIKVNPWLNFSFQESVNRFFLFYLIDLSKISLTIIQSTSWWVLGCDILTIRLWHIHSWALCDIEI